MVRLPRSATVDRSPYAGLRTTIMTTTSSIPSTTRAMAKPVGQLSDAMMEAYDFNSPLAVAVARQQLASESVAKNGKHQKLGGADNDVAQSEAAKTDPVLLSNEHVIVVRVFDRFDNVGIAK